MKVDASDHHPAQKASVSFFHIALKETRKNVYFRWAQTGMKLNPRETIGSNPIDTT